MYLEKCRTSGYPAHEKALGLLLFITRCAGILCYKPKRLAEAFSSKLTSPPENLSIFNSY